MKLLDRPTLPRSWMVVRVSSLVRVIRGVCCGLGLWVALAIALPHAAADGRSEFLVRMLTTSSQFRVRAQAALALAGQPKEPALIAALIAGLSDEHAAVRAASASAFEKLVEPRARGVLKVAERDDDPAVRSAAHRALAALDAPPARVPVAPPSGSDGVAYYVAIAKPSGKGAALSDSVVRELREKVASQVVQIAGVRIAPVDESRTDAQRVIVSKHLTGYHLDSSVTSLESRPDGSVRAQVSVVVATYPGRDIRAMLSGAATVSGSAATDADKLEVIGAAFTGALRRLPQALQAGLARAP